MIKSSSFDQRFLMVKTFLNIIWWQFLVPHSEHLLVSSATLSCMTQNILTLSMLVNYNTNSFFLSFSLCNYCWVCPSSLIIKVLCEIHFEVSLFQAAPYFDYFQIWFLQKKYLGMVPVFLDIRHVSLAS